MRIGTYEIEDIIQTDVSVEVLCKTKKDADLDDYELEVVWELDTDKWHFTAIYAYENVNVEDTLSEDTKERFEAYMRGIIGG